MILHCPSASVRAFAKCNTIEEAFLQTSFANVGSHCFALFQVGRTGIRHVTMGIQLELLPRRRPRT